MVAAEVVKGRPRRSRRATWLRRVGLFALSVVCPRIIIDLVGAIDWDAVWDGVRHLEAWQVAVLVAVVEVRQILNASPLTFFIPGLSLFRATGSDQGSALMSMVAPPTSDTLFRIAFMRSGASGSTRPPRAAPAT